MKKSSHSIETLVRKAQQGDLLARDELMDRLRPDVERHVHSLLVKFRSYKVQCVPEDVIHAVWEDFLASYQKFEKGDFELWFALRRRNRVLDCIRKELRIFGKIEHYSRSNPPQSVSEDVETRLLTRKLLENIQHLPPRQQAVIVLYHSKGWTFKEIGNFLGIKSTSVGSLQARAFNNLRKLLEE